MPKDKTYGFNKWSKTLSPSFCIYADIECLLLEGDGSVLQHHQPIAVAYLVVPNKALNLPPSYHSFVGRDCVVQFLEALENEVSCISLIPMIIIY